MKTINKNKKIIIGGAILCFSVLALFLINALEIKAVSCVVDSDCGNNYWESQFCQDNGAYGVYVEWTCKTAGTTNGICYRTKTNKQIQACSSSETCQNINGHASCIEDESESGSGGSGGSGSGTNYVYHSYTQCSNNSVYWFDSNNAKQDVYQSCSLGQTCSGNTCVNNTNNTNNNYVYNSFKGCVNNTSYWYDSLGNRQSAYQKIFRCHQAMGGTR